VVKIELIYDNKLIGDAETNLWRGRRKCYEYTEPFTIFTDFS
jgi:hypothetical protein